MNENNSVGGSMVEPKAAPQPVAPLAAVPAVPEKKPLGLIIGLVVASLVAVGGIVGTIIFYMQWDEAQTNVDGKIMAAEAIAREEQQSADEATFAEREKQPNLEFAGPSDYGGLSFMYPRTWSVYVAKDAVNGGDFEAYLNPMQVGPVSATTINALRVTIVNKPIDTVRKSYENLVKKGDLTMSVFNVGDITGEMYTGAFSADIVGKMVMFKVNDKTATLRMDAMIFEQDFAALLQTLRLN